MVVEVVLMTMQHTPTRTQPFDLAVIGGGAVDLIAEETRQAVVAYRERQVRVPLRAIGSAS